MCQGVAMPRRVNQVSQLSPIIHSFAQQIGQTLERFITDRVEKELHGSRRRAGAKSGRRGRKRALVTCYVPGCENVAAPRFGMFCAALHKNLPAAQKAEYRALHKKDETSDQNKGKPGRKKAKPAVKSRKTRKAKKRRAAKS